MPQQDYHATCLKVWNPTPANTHCISRWRIALLDKGSFELSAYENHSPKTATCGCGNVFYFPKISLQVSIATIKTKDNPIAEPWHNDHQPLEQRFRSECSRRVGIMWPFSCWERAVIKGSSDQDSCLQMPVVFVSLRYIAMFLAIIITSSFFPQKNLPADNNACPQGMLEYIRNNDETVLKGCDKVRIEGKCMIILIL